jgi:hypothetical protein
MSVGRFAMRGRVFQGRAFAPWALANSGVGIANAEIVTTRLTLIGTSMKRMAVEGTSMQRLATVGTSQERLTIEGASR